MQSMQAHLQYLLRDLSKQQQPRGACPIGEAFLGKQETKGRKHHLELLSGEEKAKPQLKSVRQGQVSELYPVYCHQPRDTRVSCSCSNATAKAASLFHSFRLFQLLRKLFQFCSEGVFDFSSNSMQAFFFNLPLAQSISYMNHNQEG